MDKMNYCTIVMTHPNVSANSQGFPELKEEIGVMAHAFLQLALASTVGYISFYIYWSGFSVVSPATVSSTSEEILDNAN